MAVRERITLPTLHPIRWRKDGFGTQVVQFGAAGTCVNDRKGFVLGEEVPRDPIQRGYVKVWYNGRVVDRALTVKAARRRITQLKAEGYQLCR